MGRGARALAAAVAVAAALLAVPPSAPSRLAEPGYTIVENRAVVLEAGLRVPLGTPVARLRGRVSLAAYDRRTGDGLAQWWGRSGAPELARVRTRGGVTVSDPSSRLRRAYGPRLWDGAPLAREYSLTPGFALGSPASAVTYVDTSCTGRVNAIGFAQGAEGLRELGMLWRPEGTSDPCAAED